MQGQLPVSAAVECSSPGGISASITQKNQQVDLLLHRPYVNRL